MNELLSFAELEIATGNVRRALVLYEEARDQLHVERGGSSEGDKTLEFIALGNAAACRLVLGEVDEAYSAANDALILGVHDPSFVGAAIQHFATIAAIRNEPVLAARLLGFVDKVFQEEGLTRGDLERQTYELLVKHLSEDLSKADVARLTAEGALMDEGQAIEDALRRSW